MAIHETIDALDVAAFVSAALVLAFAYLVHPSAVVQFSAWAIVFTIWMVWFCYYGTKRLYGVEW